MTGPLASAERTDYPHKLIQTHHRPTPNDIVTFSRRRTDPAGTADKMGIALHYEQHPHAGWIREYDLPRCEARLNLETALGRHIHGQIVSIGEEHDRDEGGGMYSEGIVRIELVKEEDNETRDTESSPTKELPGYSSLRDSSESIALFFCARSLFSGFHEPFWLWELENNTRDIINNGKITRAS